jgi:hypothetical protein
MVTQPHGIRPDSGQHFVVKHFLKPPAMHRKLRPPVARVATTGLVPEQLPVFVIIPQVFGFDGYPGKFRGQPQVGEYPNAVGQQIDTHPKRPNGGHRLVNLYPKASLMQAEGSS